MKLLARNLLPGAIAAAGIVVAQLHGVGFWIALFGSLPVGVTVSLTWEASSVWLWWRGDRRWSLRLAKWTATAALVGGMAMQSARPLLAGAGVARTGQAVLDILQGQSAGGHWISQRTLKQALGMLGAGDTSLPPALLEWTAAATLLIMPALYAMAIIALTTIARDVRDAPNGYGKFTIAEPNRPMPHPEFSHTAAARKSAPAAHASVRPNGGPPSPERRALGEFARRHGLASQAQVARAIDEPPSTLSEFANGKAGPDVAQRIAGKLTS